MALSGLLRICSELADPKKVTFVTSRESIQKSNYYIRTAGSNKTTQATSFPHPYPQIKDVKSKCFNINEAMVLN